MSEMLNALLREAGVFPDALQASLAANDRGMALTGREWLYLTGLETQRVLLRDVTKVSLDRTGSLLVRTSTGTTLETSAKGFAPQDLKRFLEEAKTAINEAKTKATQSRPIASNMAPPAPPFVRPSSVTAPSSVLVQQDDVPAPNVAAPNLAVPNLAAPNLAGPDAAPTPSFADARPAKNPTFAHLMVNDDLPMELPALDAPMPKRVVATPVPEAAPAALPAPFTSEEPISEELISKEPISEEPIAVQEPVLPPEPDIPMLEDAVVAHQAEVVHLGLSQGNVQNVVAPDVAPTEQAPHVPSWGYPQVPAAVSLPDTFPSEPRFLPDPTVENTTDPAPPASKHLTPVSPFSDAIPDAPVEDMPAFKSNFESTPKSNIKADEPSWPPVLRPEKPVPHAEPAALLPSPRFSSSFAEENQTLPKPKAPTPPGAWAVPEPLERHADLALTATPVPPTDPGRVTFGGNRPEWSGEVLDPDVTIQARATNDRLPTLLMAGSGLKSVARLLKIVAVLAGLVIAIVGALQFPLEKSWFEVALLEWFMALAYLIGAILVFLMAWGLADLMLTWATMGDDVRVRRGKN